MAELNLEELMNKVITKYTDKYVQDNNFKKTVNKGLPVGMMRRMYMGGLRKLGMQRTYRAASETVVTKYVKKMLESNPDAIGQSADVLQNLARYLDLKSELSQMNEKLAEEQERKRQKEDGLLREKGNVDHNAQREQQNLDSQLEYEKRQLEGDMERQISQMKQQAGSQAMQDLKQEFQNNLLSAGLIREVKDNYGNTRMEYDDKKLVDKLSDIFLDDILDKVEARGTGMRAFLEGQQGVNFMDKGRLQDEAEVSRLDVVGSLTRAYTQGKDYIDLEDAISRKALTEGTVDAVFALDISGSMNSYNRIEIAKRTGLALDKMLKKMNPENTTQHVVYGDSRVKQVDISEFYTVRADGDTPMAGAIDLSHKLLEEGRSDSKILYVISDGYPNVGDVIASARKFGEKRHYYLRMILIGVEAGSVQSCKEITEAAGKNSKILPVKIDKVDIAVFEDFYKMFSGFTTADRLDEYL